MSMEKHPLHTRLPELQKSGEVEKAVQRKKSKTGEKTPNDPSARIDTYLDRIENIFNPPPLEGHEKFDRMERNRELMRKPLYDAFIIKPEKFPQAYFDVQGEAARQQGQLEELKQNGVRVEKYEITDTEGRSHEKYHYYFPEALKQQTIEGAIEDQKTSLDDWVDYLTSDDAVYPTWFKYFVFRNIVQLSEFDKKLGKYKERTDSTAAKFPERHSEALAQICDFYESVVKDKALLNDPEVRAALSKKFPKLYAEFHQKSLAASLENKEEVAGNWVKYEKGKRGEAERLYVSLQNKGTGWCTAGHSTAETQVNSGDFYVFYSNDKAGIPIQPRIAIRMQGEGIAEVRGILQHQELEPIMAETLEKKLSEFGPEADTYKKKSADMRRLTTIENKTQSNEPLSQEELLFLYEIEAPIEGFGYQRDPRIKEIVSKRNPKEDAPVVLDCTPEEIAWGEQEITGKTKNYIGPLFKGVFQKSFEHIYTRFPEQPLKKYEAEVGGKTREQLTTELESTQYISSDKNDYQHDLLAKMELTQNPERMEFLRLSVGDLGFPRGATTDEVYARATELGLELCPQDAGPYLRLSQKDQPMGDYFWTAMKQITVRDGYPYVWRVDASDGERWLSVRNAEPTDRWRADDKFVFRSRKLEA